MARHHELEARAQQGECRAQLNLGLALWTGEHDAEVDLVSAYAWLQCAQIARVPYVGDAIEANYEEMSEEQTVRALARTEEFTRRYCPYY